MYHQVLTNIYTYTIFWTSFRTSSSQLWMATTCAYSPTDRQAQGKHSPSLVVVMGRCLVSLLVPSTASLTCSKKTSKLPNISTSCLFCIRL